MAVKFRKGLFPSGRPSVKSEDLQVNVLGTFDAKSEQSLRAVANDVRVGNSAIYIKATFFFNGTTCQYGGLSARSALESPAPSVLPWLRKQTLPWMF